MSVICPIPDSFWSPAEFRFFSHELNLVHILLRGGCEAIADFVQSDSDNRVAFEVATISRFPLDDVLDALTRCPTTH